MGSDPSLSASAAALAVLGLVAVAALVAGRSRHLALAVGLTALPLPFVAHSDLPLGRFGVGLFSAMACLRSIDLYRGAHRLPARARLFHMYSMYDSRLGAFGPRRFEGRRLLATLGWAALSAAAVYTGFALSPTLTGAPHYLVRWGAALVLAVAAMEATAGALWVLWAALGLRPPAIHDAPYLSRSVSEFWGQRWNRIIGTWLRLNISKPLVRRRRRRLGLALAFVASALLHYYLVLTELPWAWAALMGGFFLAQIALVAAEHAVAIERRSPAIARAWTIGALALTSPMFTECLYEIFKLTRP